MNARLNPIYPENLATYEEIWIFGGPKRPFLTAAVPKRDVICNITAIIFVSTLRIFYVEMATSEEGGGLHILSWETYEFWVQIQP